jgi:hypothetical protein
VFRDLTGAEPTPEGDVRRAFYLSYDDTNCEYLTGGEIDAGIDVVSATFVTPYPPGFPVLVPRRARLTAICARAVAISATAGAQIARGWRFRRLARSTVRAPGPAARR